MWRPETRLLADVLVIRDRADYRHGAGGQAGGGGKAWAEGDMPTGPTSGAGRMCQNLRGKRPPRDWSMVDMGDYTSYSKHGPGMVVTSTDAVGTRRAAERGIGGRAG